MRPISSVSGPVSASRNVWDLSICLDCHLRQIRRLNTAARSRLSSSSTRLLQSDTTLRIRRTYATRLPEHSPPTSHLNVASTHTSTTSRRRLSTSSQRHQDMNTSWDRGPTFPPPTPQFKIRKGANIKFDLPPGSNDVRRKLNAWRPSPDEAVPLLFVEHVDGDAWVGQAEFGLPCVWRRDTEGP